MSGIVVVFILACFVGVFGLILVAVIRTIWRRMAMARAIRDSPVLQRGATVTSKRTRVWSGRENSRTEYYATFELADRSREEFSVTGPEYGLLAEGDQGQLTTQGTAFQGFRRGATIQDRRV